MTAITSLNALDLVGSYDVVLDASDNVATRYLLNDACVISGKPLVSGSALRLEGQLTVYNHPPGVGPTYRYNINTSVRFSSFIVHTELESV